MLKFISKPETPKGLLRAYLKSYHIFFLSQWKKGLKTQIEEAAKHAYLFTKFYSK